jgi:putative transposase
MPWKETCCVDQRLLFIAKLNEGTVSVSELCRSFGISRKTAYKWLDRYEELGPAGLQTRQSAPRSHPHATPESVISALIELRKEHSTWGPKKLRGHLVTLGVAVPAASTVGALLKTHGLIKPRRRRVYPPRQPSTLAEATRPNDTWCADFKGHFALGDKTRCYPLTMTDLVSRYLLKCEGMTKTDGACVKPHFERAFREFGLPLRIRSDNGPPFATTGIGGLSELSVWWVKLGIFPERIEPGKPQQNGAHERFHKTLAEDTARPASATASDQQRSFDRFRGIYNDKRPHEHLGQTTPASHYAPSRRTMPPAPKSPEYGDDVKVRKLDEKGRLLFAGQTSKTLVSKLLAKEPVGLVPTGEDQYRLYFGPVLLAEVTLRNKELRFERVK